MTLVYSPFGVDIVFESKLSSIIPKESLLSLESTEGSFELVTDANGVLGVSDGICFFSAATFGIVLGVNIGGFELFRPLIKLPGVGVLGVTVPLLLKGLEEVDGVVELFCNCWFDFGSILTCFAGVTADISGAFEIEGIFSDKFDGVFDTLFTCLIGRLWGVDGVIVGGGFETAV